MENGKSEPVNGTPIISPSNNAKDPPQTTDEKTAETSEAVIPPKAVKTKGKKRKKPKDSTAPRHPLTGYVRFLNDRRDSVRQENPNLPFAEITKILAGEWSSLPTERKQQYLDAAEIDRERYTKEYNAYKQTDAYKAFAQLQSEKKLKESTKEEPIVVVTSAKAQNITPALVNNTVKEKDPQNNNNIDFLPANFDIPIFTEEFLDHNKSRDAELRQLRKSNTDYEQQNSILQKHIENMKSGIEKLETEIVQQKKNNSSLQNHLDHLRSTLVSGFSNVKLPKITEVPTIVTIDNYMMNLHSMLLENRSQDASLVQTVRDIVGRLEFNG